MLMALTQVFRKESQVVTARFVFRFAIFPRSGFFFCSLLSAPTKSETVLRREGWDAFTALLVMKNIGILLGNVRALQSASNCLELPRKYFLS